MWHVMGDRWHLTGDTWHVTGGEHGVKISQLWWFGVFGVLKIWRKRIRDLIKQSVNNRGDCRTAPAKPGLLIIWPLYIPPDLLQELTMRWSYNVGARACFVHLVWMNEDNLSSVRTELLNVIFLYTNQILGESFFYLKSE